MWGLAMGVHHGPFDGYGDGEHPLAGYAALIGLYNALFAAGLVLARRTGLRLPECLGPADVLLLGVGTFRLSRLLSNDSVTSALRAPFTEFEEPAGSGEVNERPRGTGLRKAVGELLTCPFCVGQWVASAPAFGMVFAPRVTRFVAAICATMTLADWLHYGNELLKQKAEGRALARGIIDWVTRGMDRQAAPEVVVITGASAGVGRATAVEFAKRGRGWRCSRAARRDSRARVRMSRRPGARRSPRGIG